MANVFVGPEARISFPNVWRPDSGFDASADPKYSVKLLFPPDADFAILAEEGKKAIDARGLDCKFVLPGKKVNQSNNWDKHYPAELGEWHALNSKRPAKLGPPRVIRIENGQQVSVSEEDNLLRPGCWVRPVLGAFAYDYKGIKKGVMFNVNALVLVPRKYEGFGSGGDSALEDVVSAANIGDLPVRAVEDNIDTAGW